MSGRSPNRLDTIWPRVRAEIDSVRRREGRRRRAARVGLSVAGGLALGMAVWGGAFGRPGVGASRRTFHAWQLRDIRASPGICADYPLAQGELLVVIRAAGNRQHLAGVDRGSGLLRWSNEIDFAQCRLAADRDRVYVLGATPGGAWRCAAFKTRTGVPLWNEPIPGQRGGAPSTLTLLPGGLGWTDGGRVVVLARDTGRVRWHRTVDSSRWLSAPVAHGGTLWVASPERLHAIRPDTGDLRWSQTLAVPAASGFSRPLLTAGRGRIYCAARRREGAGTVWCASAETGRIVWTRNTGVPLKLALQGGWVFVRSEGLSAFDARTGHMHWRVPVGGCGSISFSHDRIYLVDARQRGRVMALDRRTGRSVWSRPLTASCNGIVVCGPMAFLSGNNRTLYAFPLNKHS
ncbi:MAG: PQQ-like beta-propeller repeat protein [Verrucomicrobia bacterium]|nr:PQQ-like beta-propeller repeat protein [Verrucomicrobiota bacterium]